MGLKVINLTVYDGGIDSHVKEHGKECGCVIFFTESME